MYEPCERSETHDTVGNLVLVVQEEQEFCLIKFSFVFQSKAYQKLLN